MRTPIAGGAESSPWFLRSLPETTIEQLARTDAQDLRQQLHPFDGHVDPPILDPRNFCSVDVDEVTQTFLRETVQLSGTGNVATELGKKRINRHSRSVSCGKTQKPIRSYLKFWKEATGWIPSIPPRGFAKTVPTISRAYPAWLGLFLGAAAISILISATTVSRADAAEPVYVPVGHFGQPGTGPGELSGPHHLAIDAVSGDIVVADTAGSKIEVYRPTATGAEYVFEFGAGALGRPIGIAIDQSDGDVYVSDSDSSEIVKFVPDDRAAPTAYAPDPSFTSPILGSEEGDVGSFGEVEGFSVAGDIAVDPSTQDLLVADPGRALVERYDDEGHFIEAFDGSSSGEPFTKPADLAVLPGGDILVADLVAGGVRVLEFTPAGGYLATLGPVPNENSNLSGVALSTDYQSGEAFVGSKPGESVLSGPSRIFRFAPGAGVGAAIDDPSLGGLVFGMAATGAPANRLYVAASSALFGGTTAIRVFEAVEPPVAAIDPVFPADVGVEAASLSGTVDPQGSQVGECAFQYVSARGFEAEGFASAGSAACLPAPGAGEAPEAVAASITGLEPNTEYRVRLRATGRGDAAGLSATVAFTTLSGPPTVGTGPAGSISDTTATLTGTVDPRNSQVGDCSFEWGTTAAYGAIAPCRSGPGSGDVPVEVSADVNGLQPQTTYHFRLRADNDVGGTRYGTDVELITRSAAESALVPRGYELVSTADTDGLEPLPVAASSDGDAFAYATYLPSPGARSGGESFFRSGREPDGSWSQTYVSIPAPVPGAQVVNALSFVFSSADLATDAFATGQSLDPDDANGVGDVYLGRPGGAFAWVSRDPSLLGPQAGPPGIAPPVYISSGGAQVLFESARRLLPSDQAPAGVPSLYEWDDGVLSLVGYLPGEGGGSQTGSELGSGPLARAKGTSYGAVSADGSRVAFEAEDAEGHQQLYLRVDRERTIEVSKSAPGVQPVVFSPTEVTFWGADAEDHLIVFSSSSALTADSLAEGSPGESDLYSYDIADGSLHDLTPHVEGGGVERVYAVSRDARRVYFTSTRSLAPGKGTPGEANLYLAELDGEGAPVGPPTFIATIDPVEGGLGAQEGTLTLPQAYREVASNPDGSVLAFRDRLPLVPGRQTAARPQIYVFDAIDRSLSCASCPGDGSEPQAGANLLPSLSSPQQPEPTAAVVLSSTANPAASHIRGVSSTGAVFFQTSNSLVPSDTNGEIDTYEWHGGAVGLISAGVESHNSIFDGASADGSTVFFSSADSLVPGAQAGVSHIYAARVGGGAPSAPSSPPPCAGADCRATVAPPPSFPGLGTGAFSGPGDPAGHRPKHRKPKHHKRKHHGNRNRHSAGQRGRHSARHHGRNRNDHKRGGTR